MSYRKSVNITTIPKYARKLQMSLGCPLYKIQSYSTNFQINLLAFYLWLQIFSHRPPLQRRVRIFWSPQKRPNLLQGSEGPDIKTTSHLWSVGVKIPKIKLYLRKWNNKNTCHVRYSFWWINTLQKDFSRLIWVS